MKQIQIMPSVEIELQKILKKYPNYCSFSRCKKAAYRFVRLVGIRVCPYCNINYVYAVFDEQGNEVVRPDLDHFLSKADRAAASMKWDNLVPACQQCNSRLKLRKIFSESTHVHPYKSDFDSIERIGVALYSPNYLNEDGFQIIFVHRDSKNTENKKATSNIRDFRLRERYQYHKADVVTIFRRIKFYHHQKRREISQLLGKHGDIYPILFSEVNCDINQTSLGKLKKDITEQYR